MVTGEPIPVEKESGAKSLLERSMVQARLS
jgi:hypothetical protein